MNAIELMQKITEIMDEKDQSLSYYLGLRGMYQNETIGKMSNSFVWDDGNQTDEELNGTCAIVIGIWWDGPEFEISDIEKALKNVKAYGNIKRYGLLIGDDFQGGEDVGEVIISNAECVHIF